MVPGIGPRRMPVILSSYRLGPGQRASYKTVPPPWDWLLRRENELGPRRSRSQIIFAVLVPPLYVAVQAPALIVTFRHFRCWKQPKTFISSEVFHNFPYEIWTSSLRCMTFYSHAEKVGIRDLFLFILNIDESFSTNVNKLTSYPDIPITYRLCTAGADIVEAETVSVFLGLECVERGAGTEVLVKHTLDYEVFFLVPVPRNLVRIQSDGDNYTRDGRISFLCFQSFLKFLRESVNV